MSPRSVLPLARLSKRVASSLTAALLALASITVSAPARAAGRETVHVVSKGQTLGRIAKRYHVTVAAIREANNLRPGERIHPGLSLVIPEKGKEAEAAKRAAALRDKDDKDRPGDRRGKKGKADKKAEKDDPRGKKGKKGKKDEADDDRGRATFSKGPKRRGFVRMARGSDKLEVRLLGRRGRLAPQALAGLSRIMRFYPTGEKIAIDPRLAALIGEVSDHFGGRPLRVVSGYRPYTPAQYTPHSNHNLGRALDFSIDGVPNTVLRDFCRTFRNAGVGYYPNSSFVHLDVRAGKAYWVDHSRPGEAPHYGPEGGHPPSDESAVDPEPHPGAVPDAAPDPEAASDDAAGSKPPAGGSDDTP